MSVTCLHHTLGSTFRKPMTINHPVIRGLLVACLALALAACDTLPRSGTPAGASRFEIAKAERLLKRQEREAAADIFWEQAMRSAPPERENLQVRAVEALLTEGTAAQARQYLALIDEGPLQGPPLVRKRIAEARLALIDKHPDVALQALPVTFADIAPEYRSAILDIRAQALLENDQILASVMARVSLDQELSSPQERSQNEQSLWEALSRASDDDLQEWLIRSSDRDVAGWLELASISKQPTPTFETLQQQLMTWEQRYPAHAAAPVFTTQLRDDWQSLQFRPHKIAVLLSLSGRYQHVANTVLAGIKAAHDLDTSGAEKPELAVYDIAAPGQDLWNQYELAVLEGAEIVIGPLVKEYTNQLTQMTKLPVPILPLNYIDESMPVPANLYQFGLLPEDEAMQTAERASQDGHQRAVVLVPEGEWGKRLLGSFRTRFEQLGGTIAGAETYPAKDADYADAIKRVLQLNESTQRYQALRNLLKRDIEFEPSRRQDTDMVFFAASPRQARSLRPQLKFHFAKNLPVYATSHIYSGVKDVRRNKDLDDIIYCDMPWTLGMSTKKPELARQLTLHYDKSTRLPRLAALGVDAYRVVPYLKRLDAKSYERYSGLTGNLFMDESQNIHRELKWAQFVKGEPVVLDNTTEQ